MNKTKALILLAVALLISSNLVLLANAKFNFNVDLSNSYAINCNYAEQTIPVGATVIVTAMTNDTRSDSVNFTWVNPAGYTMFSEIINLISDGSTFPEIDDPIISYATSSYQPDTQGTWTVIVSFYDGPYICTHTFYPTLAMRTTWFNVIPEVPLIGTAGVSIAMLLGLGIFKVKRKQKQ